MGKPNYEKIKKSKLFDDATKTLAAVDMHENQKSPLLNKGSIAASNSLGSSFVIWLLFNERACEVDRRSHRLSTFIKKVHDQTLIEKLSNKITIANKTMSWKEVYKTDIKKINQHLDVLSNRLELANNIFSLFERYGIPNEVVVLRDKLKNTPMTEEEKAKGEKEVEELMVKQALSFKSIDPTRETLLKLDEMTGMSNNEKEFVQLVIQLNNVALQNEGNSDAFYAYLSKHEAKLLSLSEKINFDQSSQLSSRQERSQSTSTSQILNNMGSVEEIKKKCLSSAELKDGTKQLLRRCDKLLNELLIKRESLPEMDRNVINKTIKDLTQFIKDVHGIEAEIAKGSKKVGYETVKMYERAVSDFDRREGIYRQLNLETKEKKENTCPDVSSAAVSENHEEPHARPKQ